MSDRRRQSHPDVPEVGFSAAVRKRYQRYSRHALGFRHFAEGRDGLLPVRRRALWTMRELGSTKRGSSTKTAKATGFTTGNLHPHGDDSVSKCIANMTQFAMRYPLVVGVGNFGWHDAPPSAPRYTSCYLSPYALTMMDPSELSQVPMDLAYDGKNTEPRYLPVRLPHLLLSGCKSMAPGYAGNIPPCEAEWVFDAVLRTLGKKRLVLPEAMAYRWGGTLTGVEDTWLTTGTGSARFEPTIARERDRLLITSLAPNLSAPRIIDIMEEHPSLSSISEESPSGTELVRLVCTIRRGGSLDALEKHARTQLLGRASYSFLHIRQFQNDDGDVDYVPVIEGPQAFLQRWCKWRLGVVSGAAAHRAAEHEQAIARIELLLLAISRRSQLLRALEQCKNRQDFVARVAAILSCSQDQAAVVADTSLVRLATMNVPGMREDIAAHRAKIRTERAIEASPLARMTEDAAATLEVLKSVSVLAIERPKKRRRGEA